MTILFTSDLHGRVGPMDPLSGQPVPGGAARVATLIAAARRRDPHAVYVDLGDVIQGTPMSTLAAREHPDRPHPMIRILNRMGCVGMVVGNHDFNFGLPFLRSLRRSADFPLLAANVLGPDGKPYFHPVLKLKHGERRIAILGLTTPQVPRFEEPWNIQGLTFVDAVETARKWVEVLRPQADAIVVAAHMGWDGVSDGGLEEPEPAENAVRRLVDEVEGIDAVLMAHTHRFDERYGKTGALAVQAAWGGLGVGVLELTWTDGNPRPEPAFDLLRASPDVEPDPLAREIARVAHRDAQRIVDEVVGEATAPFRIEGARYRDNAILSLFHRAHFHAVETDLSSTALFRSSEELAAGPIRRGDLFRIYPYENDLTILELTVDDVRDYLEEIARAYLGPASNGTPPPLHPQVLLYNHDTLAGCDYVIDPARPVGQRVVHFQVAGADAPGDRKVSLAVTSYRAQGGGGYAALRRARVVERTGRDMRRLLAEFVVSQGRVEPITFDNWSVEGAPAPARA